MGKWTVEHYDRVLGSKLKSLVDGAITRSKLEKTEPDIGYETFVEELDAGDSFTTALIEILVKEIAERRTRPTAADRRLIADRSAQSLRQLATPLRIYHEPRAASTDSLGSIARQRLHEHGASAPRRISHFSEYSTAPPDELEIEEDDENFGNPIHIESVNHEGATLNEEMYDAYSREGSSWPRPPPRNPLGHTLRRRLPISSSSINRNQSGSLSPSSSGSLVALGGWGPQASASESRSTSSLLRQASIRRPTRSRTVDFNDFTEFTSRRRGVTRDNRESSVHMPRDNGDRSSPEHNSETAGDTDTDPWTYPARRFFPLGSSERERSPRIRREYPELFRDAVPSRSSLPSMRARNYVWDEPSPDVVAWGVPHALPTPTSSSSSVLENGEGDFDDLINQPSWHSHFPAGSRPRSSAARRIRNLRRSMLRDSESIPPEARAASSSTVLEVENLEQPLLETINPARTVFVFDGGDILSSSADPRRSSARDDGDRTPTQRQRLATPPEDVAV